MPAAPRARLDNGPSQDATLTHPNAICQHANRVYAETVTYAIRTGSAPESIYRYALEVAERTKSPKGVIDAVVNAASKPPDDYSRQMGWVLIALQNAFWQLLHAESLEQGVASTVMSGGDTDTNAAIAGALLGAVRAMSSVPLQWLDRILTCRPISGVAGHPRPAAFWRLTPYGLLNGCSGWDKIKGRLEGAIRRSRLDQNRCPET